MPGFAVGGVFDLELVERLPGFLVFTVSGKSAHEIFQNEAGGHRWQRVPPTEKRGRVQTSTITVAVLNEPTEVQIRLSDRDLDWKTCRASGSGGQNVNKVESAVQLTHLPSGLSVKVQTERSQHQNRATALSLLRARLWEREQTRVTGNRDALRRAMLGSGMRGDKIRTIRVQDGTVQDHVTGKSWKYKDYERGNW